MWYLLIYFTYFMYYLYFESSSSSFKPFMLFFFLFPTAGLLSVFVSVCLCQSCSQTVVYFSNLNTVVLSFTCALPSWNRQINGQTHVTTTFIANLLNQFLSRSKIIFLQLITSAHHVYQKSDCTERAV